MTIETSKNTGYAVHSSVPSDSVSIVKTSGYAVQSTLPDDELVMMKETCYVVLKPAPPLVNIVVIEGPTVIVGKVRIGCERA